MSKMPEPDDFPPGETVSEMYLHIIFWTRKLAPAVTPYMLASATEVMDQAMFTVDGEALAAGGSENHLHILARVSPDHSVQEALDALRRHSEAWAAKDGGKPKLIWSDDEVAVTISPDEVGPAKDFINSQQAHHQIVSFQSELKAIFDEHGFDYNERELWG